MSEYFKKAGSLDFGDINKENRLKSTFGNKSQENIESRVRMNFPSKTEDKAESRVTMNFSSTKKEIEKDIISYLNQISSGKEFDDECELGVLCGAGEIIISLNQLRDMVATGTYNIIKTEWFNSEMILVKYQEFSKEMRMFR